MSEGRMTRLGRDVIAVQFPACSFNVTLKDLVGKADSDRHTAPGCESTRLHSDGLI